MVTPGAQIFAISTSKAMENKLNNLQKEKKYKIENSECNYQFIATVNVYLKITKLS